MVYIAGPSRTGASGWASSKFSPAAGAWSSNSMSGNTENTSIAAFLITRPPIGIMGTRAELPSFSLQPRTPPGLCKKEGGGVLSREWTNGVARLDCGSFASSLPFP